MSVVAFVRFTFSLRTSFVCVATHAVQSRPMTFAFAASSAAAAAIVGAGFTSRRGVGKNAKTAAGRRVLICRATSANVDADKVTSIKAPEGWVAPDPQKFTVSEGQLGNVVSAAVPLVLRVGTGALINGWKPSLVDDDGAGYSLLRVAGKKLAEASELGPRPENPIEVFEYEGSPYCRKVREAAAVLDLDVVYRPCPSGETYWRPMAKGEGAATFPYMKDPNTGAAMTESDDIVEYLFRNYGPMANAADAATMNAEELGVPFMLRRGGLTNPTCYAAAVARLKGLRARPSRAAAAAAAGEPVQPLELWTYESSPFTKSVRETLTELAIPHVVKYCPRGSKKRDQLLAKKGTFQVPYLEDPNTGVAMFESAAMVEYLEATYALDA